MFRKLLQDHGVYPYNYYTAWCDIRNGTPSDTYHLATRGVQEAGFVAQVRDDNGKLLFTKDYADADTPLETVLADFRNQDTSKPAVVSMTPTLEAVLGRYGAMRMHIHKLQAFYDRAYPGVERHHLYGTKDTKAERICDHISMAHTEMWYMHTLVHDLTLIEGLQDVRSTIDLVYLWKLNLGNEQRLGIYIGPDGDWELSAGVEIESERIRAQMTS